MEKLLFFVYLICSVGGMVLFKRGSGAVPLNVILNKSAFSFQISWMSLVGMAFYIISFIVYMILISKNTLSTLVPLATAGIYLLTMLAAVVIFNEKTTLIQGIGSVLIIAGVVLMNLKKG